MPHDRQFYAPEVGTALDANNDVFDVTQWRKNGNQTRNGQEHFRSYDPDATMLLKKILVELTKMNTHLEILTGEEL